MLNRIILIAIVSALTVMSACGKESGPDSISSHGALQGAVVSDCTSFCHTPLSAASPDPLATNGTETAGKHVLHVTSLGFSCERCHINYLNDPAHMNGQVNGKGVGPSPVRFDSLNAAGLWTYVVAQRSGTCSATACHGSTQPLPDWYGTQGWTLPDCSACHNAALGTRRQVLGAAGDFATNPSVTSHHVASASDPTADQCKVCHDQSRHMAGTVRLRSADTGSRIDYDPANPGTLEPFCLSCHDTDGAAGAMDPFADGRTLGVVPHEAGNKIAGSWTGSSIHKNRGLTCAGTGGPNTGCHGRAGAINMHGSTNKGLLTNTMNFQIPLVSLAVYSADPLGSSFNTGNYKLCFDCHANYPAVTKEVVLGYRQGGVYDIFEAPTPYFTPGIRSLFRDRFIDPLVPANFPTYWGGVSQFYNDDFFGFPNLALHNFHLLGFRDLQPVTADNVLRWKYRGDPAQVGRITCTACHNVHGTSTPTIRSTYSELGMTTVSAGAGPDLFTPFDPLFGGINAMTSFPANCAFDCHGTAGNSSYWHTPAVE